jgi:MFS family permease
MGCACQWPSPGLLLLSLCCATFLIFIDRGAISSNGVGGGTAQQPESSGLVVDFNLSGFESGCIPALYFVGLAIGAPVFGQLAKRGRFNAFRLVGAGLLLFGVGALATGFVNSFSALLAVRCLVGFGNGAVIALGPPLIGWL